MFPTNNELLIGISDAFSAFVYGYPSSCPRAHCTPNKSVPTLRYTRRPGPVYTGHVCRHLPSAVPWISEDRLLKSLVCIQRCRSIETAFCVIFHAPLSARGPLAEDTRQRVHCYQCSAEYTTYYKLSAYCFVNC